MTDQAPGPDPSVPPPASQTPEPERTAARTPLVGLGGSAGGIPALQTFFHTVPADSGMAFVVVLHLSPEHESTLPELLQRCTRMAVVPVRDTLQVQPDTVYVIPPRMVLEAHGRELRVAPLPPDRGRHVAVDLFFRSLGDAYGPHAAAVVLSGADGDGAVGIKRIKERGGLTIAQDPDEAEHGGMPRSSIATGMVDWVLPVGAIAPKLLEYFRLESRVQLPPVDGPQPVGPSPPAGGDEAALREVLSLLRARTGRDFSSYKRATILRRIGRRMQVNGVDQLADYLACLRTRAGEASALLHDLLISVTNFFRDPACFAALERHVAQILAGKGPGDLVRVWVPACATGEEAYSLGMLFTECARSLDAPPAVQIFATDLDDDAVQAAREGIYPAVVEADLSEERLKRFFVKEHRGYRVRRELREMVLFAQHDLLKDSPFSRLDLVSCRNLLIYLNRDAQGRVLDIFHFALVPGGRLFLGSSETVDDGSPQFAVLDKKHRIYQQRPAPRIGLPVPSGPGTLALAQARNAAARPEPPAPGVAPGLRVGAAPEGRGASWGEVHLRLLEQLAPPSVLVDADHEIVHLSPSAGRFLQFAAGEPSHNLLRSVDPGLRIELRAALLKAAQTRGPVEVPGITTEVGGQPFQLTLRVAPAQYLGSEMFLVLFQSAPAGQPGLTAPPQRAEEDALARHLDRELERLKAHLRDTVEQYEASTEELKAGNEELQAMNEELRSATEELETSREELQSINEELTTVNQELKNKVEELGQANSDMHNLMDATAIATVFLDRELRITRFTPSAVALFNLIPTDVGRPLTDLKTELHYPELGTDARRVLEKLVPIEREVGQGEGRWFLARLLPYRTIDDRIGGIVLSFIDITERKRAEEMRLWLSAVVTASSDAIISFSLDGTILSWNHGAERIFGYPAAEAIGQPVALLAAPEDSQQQQVLEHLATAEAVENFEVVRRRKDGTQVQVALTVSPIRDDGGQVIAGTALARDITEQKRAARALRESEERLRLVMENATEFAIFSMDLQRRVTVWNAGAQRLLGFRGDEIVGATGDVIFVEEDRAAGAPEQEMTTALATGRAGDERWHLRKDGSRFWASGVMMLMRDAQGVAVGFVKILRDQTEARESREALERSRAELLRVLAENEKARADLQAADAAKDRFLAVLSHELRNPLASIDSSAALLLAPGLPARDRTEAAEVIQRQAHAMKDLLDELLDLSRLRLGRMTLRRERTTLKAVVGPALESTRPAFAAAGHKLSLDLPDEPVELDADPLRLVQVIANLLGNAAKYTPSSGAIALKARVEGDQVVITVSDTGMGMEPAQIERMFEMFAQGDPAADRSQGLGIGLALVKSIVELHGGQMVARSAGRGKGSEFELRLPLARGEPPAPSTRAPTPAPSVAPAAAPPAALPKQRGLVLIADDNGDAAWGIARLLEIAGFATLCVKGGVEAVQQTRRHKPDVGVIDVGMPDLDGHAVARQIRQTEWGKHMVLVAATGWGQEADQEAALAAGFDAHMTKPVDLRRLSATVDDLLARKRG